MEWSNGRMIDILPWMEMSFSPDETDGLLISFMWTLVTACFNHTACGN